MLLLTGILMVVAGLLAAASLVVAKRPEARAAIDKLAPFQGIIGVVAAVWGAWQLIQALIHVGLITKAPFLWSLGFAAAAVMLALGFILGYALIARYAMRTPEAAAKGELVRARLVKVQTPLGLASVALGVAALVFSVTHGLA